MSQPPLSHLYLIRTLKNSSFGVGHLDDIHSSMGNRLNASTSYMVTLEPLFLIDHLCNSKLRYIEHRFHLVKLQGCALLHRHFRLDDPDNNIPTFRSEVAIRRYKVVAVSP